VPKIDRIRASTASAPPPSINSRVIHETLIELSNATANVVKKILCNLLAKQCHLDPAPTWLWRLGFYFAAICNVSFQQQMFSRSWKKATVTPLLKSRTWTRMIEDLIDPYPTSAYYQKLLRRRSTKECLQTSADTNYCQSSSSSIDSRSNETAVLCLCTDMNGIIDRWRIGFLTLLDLSAAFDMVDHFTLMDVFTWTFGISGGALGSMMGISVIAAQCSSSRCKSDAGVIL